MIITFFIMIIILSIVLFVSIILYSEVRIIRNMGNSMVSLYAADSGVEKVLFYDRQVLPTIDEEGGVAKRGVCSMYMYDPINNPNACRDLDDERGETSLYCDPDIEFMPPRPGASNPDGCDWNTCNDCEIYFTTKFDDMTYKVRARVFPSEDGKETNFEIESKGFFADASRQIKIVMAKVEPESAITIERAYANPPCNPRGTKVYISAYITPNIPGDTIASVVANIHDGRGNFIPGATGIVLKPSNGVYDGPDLWSGSWSSLPTSPMQGYYVDIEVIDTLNPPNIIKKTNIPASGICLDI